MKIIAYCVKEDYTDPFNFKCRNNLSNTKAPLIWKCFNFGSKDKPILEWYEEETVRKDNKYVLLSTTTRYRCVPIFRYNELTEQDMYSYIKSLL